MKYEEFLERYKVGREQEDWFLTKRLFSSDLKVLGWKVVDSKPLDTFHGDFNNLDIVCTHPNFYRDGHIVAQSRKSIIMSSGFIEFISHKNNRYSSLYRYFQQEDNAMEELNNIKWLEVKDWIIVNKKSGEMLAQFDTWDDCPTRKELE